MNSNPNRETKINRITAEVITDIMDDILEAGEFGTLIQLIKGTNYIGILDSTILPLSNQSDLQIDQLYNNLITKGAKYPWEEKDYYANQDKYLTYLSAVSSNDEWLES